jgi:hypothetical protein
VDFLRRLLRFGYGTEATSFDVRCSALGAKADVTRQFPKSVHDPKAVIGGADLWRRIATSLGQLSRRESM